MSAREARRVHGGQVGHEFGPRAVVYHEGSRYEISRVILPMMEDGVLTSRAKQCGECGYVHPIADGPGPDNCERCRALLPDALRDLLAVQNRQISIENIQKTVADYYKIRMSDMHSKKRSRAVARPRQVAMALAKELTQQSLPEIGSNFGGRDHSTVLHACRKIQETLGCDLTVSGAVQQLRAELL